MTEDHRLTPGDAINLSELATRADTFHENRKAAEKVFNELRIELAEWQRRLYAHGEHKLLIVLQAMDAGGKDSTIRKVFRGVNPQGVRVNSFKAPTSADLAHDFLWRVHKLVPGTGTIGVFNRSHYEDVLVVRVEEIVPQSVWEARYEQINQFEKLLTETGTTILKFYLHISKDEQRERFQDRIDEPEKHWKFSHADLEKREQWDAYMEVYQAALNRCTTEWAPWYVIPADQKWYRNLAIARALVGTLRNLNPEYPSPKVDISHLKID
ncbi:MAG: polyphosphate kinase [Planctomycetaceae bacterium]|nr:polyphosphate kinase [Planctomycetaceae bacterium]